MDCDVETNVCSCWLLICHPQFTNVCDLCTSLIICLSFCFFSLVTFLSLHSIHIQTHTHTHTHTILWPSCILPGTTPVSRHQKGKTRKVKPIWIYWSKREWVAVIMAENTQLPIAMDYMQHRLSFVTGICEVNNTVLKLFHVLLTISNASGSSAMWLIKRLWSQTLACWTAYTDSIYNYHCPCLFLHRSLPLKGLPGFVNC